MLPTVEVTADTAFYNDMLPTCVGDAWEQGMGARPQ